MPTDTFAISDTQNDKLVAVTGATYPPTGAATYGDPLSTTVFGPARYFDGASTYNISCGLLKWDTSTLNDAAIIDSVNLKITFSNVDNANARNLTADWFNWNGANAAADYRENGDSSSFSAGTTAIASVALSTLTINVVTTIALSNPTQLNKAGNTGLRLHIDGGQPTNYNDTHIKGMELAPAQLEVTWHLPTTRIAPDAILSQTNLTGSVTDIDEDPDSGDANWLIAP